MRDLFEKVVACLYQYQFVLNLNCELSSEMNKLFVVMKLLKHLNYNVELGNQDISYHVLICLLILCLFVCLFLEYKGGKKEDSFGTSRAHSTPADSYCIMWWKTEDPEGQVLSAETTGEMESSW